MFNLYPLVLSPETLSCATFLSAPVLWGPMTRTDKIHEVLHKALVALMPLSAGEVPAVLRPQMLLDSVWQDSFQMTYICPDVIPVLKSKRSGLYV